jgi:hypothetical protein
MVQRVVLLLVAAVSLGAELAGAQTLADLQPGRNFSGVEEFGAGWSSEIDPGDVDNDGDMDVIVANGGDFQSKLNRIFINLGGLQAGSIGSFADETAVRFGSLIEDSTRDADFVDVDSDGDLDLFYANNGTGSVGQPSRFHVNHGGLQAGTLGHFVEETDDRWGTLVSVPAGQQVFGGNQGPFREFCGDSDFADLDDDGDTDLFMCSYGPNIGGNFDSRVFLNDGSGVFNEQYPWANAGADTKMHAMDSDCADLDGDFDIDVFVASRNSQSRTFLNNLYSGLGASPFQDITQAAIIATGATSSATVTYESEHFDADGDGDFDFWMVGYDGNLDRLLRNNGFVAGTGYSFSEMTAWIKGDPNVDENEADVIDYDADGDLDVFMANFSGTDWIYQSGLAQGLAFETVGLLHRTGTTAAGSLAPLPETSTTENGGTTLDADVADIDNDGDEDVLVANDSNQGNVLHRNILGVPDTRAPKLQKVTEQPDTANGPPTVIHAQVRDNSASYLVGFYPVSLVYSVDGGAPVSVPMFSQGGQQFRGVIPAQTDALIAWHVEASDLAGNTGASHERYFLQGDPPGKPWFDIGFGLAGTSGVPSLTGTGTLVAASPLSIDLTGAAPGELSGLFLSLVGAGNAFHGGVLKATPFPVGFPILIPTGTGSISISDTMPGGANGLGLKLYFQYAIQDPAGIDGYALSNCLLGVVP